MKFSLDPTADVAMTPLSRKQAVARIAAKQPLDSVMLREMDLSDCDLSQITCTKSGFIKVIFRGVSFEGAKFSQSLFQECQMAGARAAGVTLHQSPLVQCDLTGRLFRLHDDVVHAWGMQGRRSRAARSKDASRGTRGERLQQCRFHVR